MQQPTRILAGCLAIGAAVMGCITPTELFDADFLQAIGVQSAAARLPGDTPSVVIGVRNDTSFRIEAQLSWRDGQGDVHTFAQSVFPNEGATMGTPVLLSEFCPVTELTLGDVSDLSATGAVVRLGNGSLADPFVQVEPFGVLLKEGVHYECGDRVVFSIRETTATPSGFQIFAEVERSDAGG